MKMKLLVPNVTAIGSPGRAERAVLGGILTGRVTFLNNAGHICGWGATLWCRNLLLSSNNFTWGHLVRMEWLVADVTAVGCLDRAERAILEVIVAGCVFGQFRSFLWSGSHFVV